ncbi:MAG: type I-E CRISPR-associated endonuclease Cas1e [Actinomycetales bacterium]
MPPPELPELVRAQDRLSFVYLERCIIHRDGNAITATDDQGQVHIPAASLGALLLGPGCNVSHPAMMLLAESGSTAVWVGERGVRYYAHGRSLARSSRLLLAQAALVSNQSSRLKVAREMYQMRFEGEDVASLTMQQLRGREGARVRKTYREHAHRTGVEWKRRDYDVDDFTSSNPINQALSAAHTCLYGVTHAVVVALGCSPGLGFVHTGHVRSFVFDLADLYKAEIAVPVAFDVAAREPEDIPGETRRAVRDAIYDGSILSRCSADIHRLLLGSSGFETQPDWDRVELWDGRGGTVAAGRSYGVAEEGPPESVARDDQPGDGEVDVPW